MDQAFVISVGTEAVKVAMMLAGPMLIAAMAIGILISVLQAVTQINEATLTFIPKIFAVVLVLVIMAPWMMKVMQTYSANIFSGIGTWAK